ncbi:5'_nucleotidase family protein [Hexamita inflata]|uniref:5' nucleotidase family protein n=1 Tax=Hexamita inflata TaxID=28002 RepID=A0AA86TQG9_9EUKA|nr:5' nucleotidase family protein [Hexamita inflata]
MIVAPTQAGEGLAARFNIFTDSFDTEDAIILRIQVQAKIKQANVYQVIGASKFTYVYEKGVYFNDSFQRLWNQALMPALVYNLELQKRCYQFPITRVDNTFRKDLQQGNISLEDAVRMVPFSFNTTYFPNIEPEQAQCLYFWGNHARWNHDHDVISIERFQELFQKYKHTSNETAKIVPFYSVNNNTWEGPCYDMITTNYEQKRLTMGYKYCGISGHEPKVDPTQAQEFNLPMSSSSSSQRGTSTKTKKMKNFQIKTSRKLLSL